MLNEQNYKCLALRFSLPCGLDGVNRNIFAGDRDSEMFFGGDNDFIFAFFEEFGFPGGFPYIGMKVLMKSEEKDSTKWSCNNLSSMFGNWGFLFLLYIVPLIFPTNFLILSGMLFLFVEVFMHLILFNVALKTFYNLGMITGIFGCGAVGIYYFTQVFDKNIFATTDYIFAVIYFVAVFMFSFRSKLYWDLGKIFGYDLTRQSAYGLFKV